MFYWKYTNGQWNDGNFTGTVSGGKAFICEWDAEASIEIPEDAKSYKGHSYKIFDNSISWSEAKTFCESFGGHLVCINSQEEQNFLIELSNSSTKKNLWIGAKADANGVYSWVNGDVFEYTNWASGEPNNVFDSQYTAMMYTHNASYEAGLWNDENENGRSWDGYYLSDFGFVCEWDYGENANEGDADDSFLKEHLSFATNEKISALIKQNGFHSFGKINKWNLFWYNTYDVVGDIFDVCTFNFGDLSISANYYEMYLADMILALNGANSLGYLENKIFQSLSEIYSGLESALQTDAEWLDSANSSFVDEIKDISIGKANTISEGAKDFLQKHLNKLYKNNKSKITSIFANLSDASKFVDAFFLAEDVANAFIDAIKAYAVSKAFYEVNDEFFNVCIEAGNLMKSEGSAKHGRWFLDAVYKAQNSELGKFDAIFDGFYTWALPATDILYQTVMPEFIKGYVYNSVSNVLGATVGKVSAAFTIGNAAYDLLDIITDGSEESKQYHLIHYILSVEKQLNAVVDLRKERLLNSPLDTNAISYDVAYAVLRQTNMYLCDATYKYASLRNNSNDMSACISFKNWWNQTMCHSGNYDGKYNIFSAHCPVDVYIYDLNGVLVTSVVDEKIVEHDARITVTIGNGHKSFAYSSDEKFTFVIKAREEGEMDYSFSQLNDTEIENKYVSYNIPLEVEQEFSVTIPTSTANGDDFKLNTNETQVDFD